MSAGALARELFAHHTWAGVRLVDHCAGLPPEALEAGAPGTYGTVIATLRHLAGADERYLSVLEGRPFREDLMEARSALDLDALRALAEDHGRRWERLLDAEGDPERPVTRKRPDGGEHTITARTLYVQAIHHGNDHRAHVCTVLGASGYPVPDLDSWTYYEERLRPLVHGGD